MKRLHFLVSILLLWGCPALAQAPPETRFSVEEGGQSNLFLDDDLAQVHLLLRPTKRLVFAFPAQNSGIGLWFEGRLEAIPESLRSLPSGGSSQQVEAHFRVLEATTVSKVLLDSIRTLRDESEGAPTSERIARARGKGEQTRREVRGETVHWQRHQRFLPSDSGDFELDLTPARLDADGRLQLTPGELTVRARLPFPPLTRFSAQELYRPQYLSWLRREPGRLDDSLRALEFLTRREKMMAGSWRFLTYFGRDTLISASMLEPILSDQALAAALRSVLERLSPDGQVAHEEDIGPWAEWRHLQAGEDKGMEPVYDYKMIDDDLLLPVLLRKLRENGRGAVVDALMKEPVSRRAILSNAHYVLGQLAGRKLMRLRPGQSTGDWRDSNEGLGGGVYPASVNAELALPALDAVMGIFEQAAETRQLSQARGLRPTWEKLAASYWIELSPAQVRQRLDRFAASLDPEQRTGWDRLVQSRADLLQKPFRFPVLSFNDDGTAVVVPHTDVAFTLFYGHPDGKRLEAILALLERPFPYGLATPAGHLVASPVFSTNPMHYKSLGFGQYHGLVVWSWPSAMLQLGLLRQRGRFPALDGRIEDLLAHIEQSEANVGPLATSELWAVGLDATGLSWRPYGTAGDQAESNALQLWSTIYPALEYARAGAHLPSPRP
jgi:hypothetical protein